MAEKADRAASVSGTTTTRVRYPETDRMGVAHHTHFFVWFELGRTELMRDLGCTYGELEDREIVFFPVVRAEARYREPARYDEVLEIRTCLSNVGGARVRFDYEVLRQSDGTTLGTGMTEHASVGSDGRPARIPSELRKRLRGLATLALAVALLSGATSCANKKVPTVSRLQSAEADYRDAVRSLNRREFRRARAKLEKVQLTPEDREDLEPLVQLALADLVFYQGDDLSLIDARSKYQDFVLRYPDHDRAAYAQYQVGICSLKQVRNPWRDQGQTQVAVTDLREVERRFPRSFFASLARREMEVAEGYIAEHEFLVGRFYLKRKIYDAAIDRFRAILRRFPRYAETQKVYYHLGQALIRADRDDEGRLYLDKLLADFPDGEYAKEAKRALVIADRKAKRNGESS